MDRYLVVLEENLAIANFDPALKVLWPQALKQATFVANPHNLPMATWVIPEWAVGEEDTPHQLVEEAEASASNTSKTYLIPRRRVIDRFRTSLEAVRTCHSSKIKVDPSAALLSRIPPT